MSSPWKIMLLFIAVLFQMLYNSFGWREHGLQLWQSLTSFPHPQYLSGYFFPINSLEVYFFLTSPSNCLPAQWLMTEESVIFKSEGGVLFRTSVIVIKKCEWCMDCVRCNSAGMLMAMRQYAACKLYVRCKVWGGKKERLSWSVKTMMWLNIVIFRCLYLQSCSP